MKKTMLMVHGVAEKDGVVEFRLFDGTKFENVRITLEEFKNSFKEPKFKVDPYMVYLGTSEDGRQKICPMLERWADIKAFSINAVALESFSEKKMSMVHEVYHEMGEYILRVFDGSNFLTLHIDEVEFEKSFKASFYKEGPYPIYIAYGVEGLKVCPCIERWAEVISDEKPEVIRYDHHEEYA